MLVCAAVALALSGCVTVPTGGDRPTTAAAAPQSYLERLKDAPVDKPTEAPSAGTLAQFVTDSRNVACVFTTSRAGNLNQPWEPNNYADAANAKAPIVPVVNCELASYPDPAPADVSDHCSGTNIGYLGGTVLLTPDKVGYGECRAGVTAAEASYGPDGTVTETMSGIPVLAQGQAMEQDGYRCAPLDDGVACANLSSGLGFYVSSNSYELFGPGHKAAPTPGTAATVKATAG